MSGYYQKAVAVDAAQFQGQELPNVERQYLGTNEVGLPVWQGILTFDGGSATLREGDWLVDGKVWTDAAFHAHFEYLADQPAPPVVEMPPAPAPAVIVADTITQAEIDGLQARIDALRAGIT